jgi:predicted nucleotidyltransferase
MTRTVDLPQQDRMILQAVLRAHLPPHARIWVFGSRATDTARRYSDLDLAIEDQAPLEPAMLARLRDALSESDLTIKVDTLDLRTMEPTFRRLIEGDLTPLALDGGPGVDQSAIVRG